MNISVDTLINICVSIASVTGVIVSTRVSVKGLEKALDQFKIWVNAEFTRLEKKQDKHNGLIERMVVVEQSSKSAHHRLDHMEKHNDR